MGHHGAVKQVVGPALGHPHQLAVAITLQALGRELVGKHLVGILVQGNGLPGIFGQTGKQQAFEIVRVQQVEPQPAQNAHARAGEAVDIHGPHGGDALMACALASENTLAAVLANPAVDILGTRDGLVV